MPNGLDLTAWVNGRMVAPDEPVVTAGDRGLVGDGVFEALKVVDGVPFAPTRHLARLQASAAPLGIAIDASQVQEGIDAVTAADRLRSGAFWLRVTVTGGVAEMGKAQRGVQPTVLVTAAPLPRWPPTCTAVIVPWTRNQRGALAGLKTLSYIENGIALRYAHAQGADEGLFENTIGNLCEGAGTNVFVVVDGVVKTPPLSAGALDGITRQLLLEWVPEIVVEDMPIDLLHECGEVFVTSTSRDVHPVAMIDDRALAGLDGYATRDIAAAFRERAQLPTRTRLQPWRRVANEWFGQGRGVIPILDTHVHFWDHGAAGLSWPWLERSFKSAQHRWTGERHRETSVSHDATRYTVGDFRAETTTTGVAGLVHVHSAKTSEDPSQETAWLEGMAQVDGWPLAIVGRGALESPDGPALLRRHRSASDRCAGIRDMAARQGIDPDRCVPTLEVASELGFAIELRTAPDGFGVFAALAAQWPEVTFVLSHASLPTERTPDSLVEWRDAATQLGERPNWVCKISALCGGSDPDWTVDSIRPWARACLEVFGPDRCMLGTNWPVDRLFGSYDAVVSAYREVFDDLTDGEQRRLFYGTAAEVYGIDAGDLSLGQ